MISNELKTMLTHVRRTIERVCRKVALTSATLTLSFPPFFKLEIKTEPKPTNTKASRKRHA